MELTVGIREVCLVHEFAFDGVLFPDDQVPT